MDPIQHALDSQNFRKLSQLILSHPPKLPANQIGETLEKFRRIADTLIQSLDPKLSFETAYHARSSLLSTPIPTWVVHAFRVFSFDPLITARLSVLMQHLGMCAEGRGTVGSVGGVDQLAVAWSGRLECVEIVGALVALCSGHIDNVSRCMRRRAITTAVQVIEDEEFNDQLILLEQTVVLLGLCAICTPDNEKEAAMLVPALQQLLVRSMNCRRARLQVKILSTLANIFDCWNKEQNGYHISDPDNLVEHVIEAWTCYPSMKEMAGAAVWLFMSMTSTPFKEALMRNAEKIEHLTEPWIDELKTAERLHTIVSKPRGKTPIMPTRQLISKPSVVDEVITGLSESESESEQPVVPTRRRTSTRLPTHSDSTHLSTPTRQSPRKQQSPRQSPRQKRNQRKTVLIPEPHLDSDDSSVQSLDASFNCTPTRSRKPLSRAPRTPPLGSRREHAISTALSTPRKRRRDACDDEDAPRRSGRIRRVSTRLAGDNGYTGQDWWEARHIDNSPISVRSSRR